MIMQLKFAALVVLSAAVFCGAADKRTVDPEFAEFLGWYKTYTGSFNPQDVLKAYLKRLASEGVPETEAQRRVGAIQSAVRSMPVEFTALHFDKIYAAAHAPFSQKPSAFVMKLSEDLKPGKALDVAMGQGRNALYLASKGWNVTGYDISEEGLRIAKEAARQGGVSIETVKASHDEFDYGKQRWDLIVQTFAFTQLNDDAYRKRLVDSLRPGGLLLIEGFGGPERGAPKNVMLEGFRDLRVLYYEDRVDVADWSMQKARVTRIAVQKD